LIAGDTGKTEPKEQQPGNSQAKGPPSKILWKMS